MFSYMCFVLVKKIIHVFCSNGYVEMDKWKRKRQKLAVMLIVSTVVCIASCMVALFVTSRLHGKKRKCITYGPIEERDKSRIQYLNNKIFKDDTTCTKMLRLKKEFFLDYVKFYGNVLCYVTLCMYVWRINLPCS
jgi:hypothetical protein